MLAAQSAALAAVQPGRRYSDIHDSAVKVLAQGMLDVGLLDKAVYGSADERRSPNAPTSSSTCTAPATGWASTCTTSAPTATSHAEGKPSRPLQPGMVLTVEPGIYVRPAAGVPEQFWNIGIRIEDDVLVTPDGHSILSDSAPRTVADIEQAMRQR